MGLDPVSWAAIAAGAAAVSAAGGAVYSGVQQKKAANYNASVQEAQAKAIDTQTRESIRRQRTQNQSIMRRRERRLCRLALQSQARHF